MAPGRIDRERVLDAATAIADGSGLEAMTMRALAARLGVKPMSIYHHVAGKDAVLDGLVDRVFTEMALPTPGRPWRDEVAARARSARTVLLRHPWAVGLLESRSSPGAATLRQHDAMLGVLREAGFSLELAGHAYALLDAYVYGFVVQEVSLPFEDTPTAEVAESIMSAMPEGEYPYLVEYAVERAMAPGYSFGAEFDVGLGLVLDAVEGAFAAERSVSDRSATMGR